MKKDEKIAADIKVELVLYYAGKGALEKEPVKRLFDLKHVAHTPMTDDPSSVTSETN